MASSTKPPVQTIRSLMGAPDTKPTLTDSVLAIIDAQNEYATGLLQTERVEETRAAISALLKRYRSAGGSVIHVVQDMPPGAPAFTPGTPLAEIFDELTPTDGEAVVRKVHASAFTGTNFKELVDKTEKKRLVVVGYMAHNCVSATVRAAAELGYEAFVPSDAVGDRHIPGATADELVRVSLAELADAVAAIIQSADIS